MTMSTTDLLARLASLCKCSVSIEINKHRDYYETAAQYVETANYHLSCQKNDPLDPEISAEIIKRDSVVEITFYPDTPIGNYTVRHYDLRMALETAVAIAERGDGP